jgi:hypothetical protein
MSFSPDRKLNIPLRHFIFFDQAVRQYSGNPTVKEIEHSVIHGSESNAKLINPIAQKICLGAAKFMPQIAQSLDSNKTFVQSPFRQRIQPIEHRNYLWILSIEHDGCLWHGL